MANNVLDRDCWNFENTYKSLVKMTHGRRYKAEEYYEFKPYNRKYRYLAQRSGLWIIIYRVYPGVNGKVETLGSSLNPKEAIKKAFDLALKDAQE